MISRVNSSPTLYQPYIKSQNVKSQTTSFISVSNSSAPIKLDKNALVSAGVRVPGGGMMSASVFKSDNYSADNPVMIVKGISDNGESFEVEININDVNPRNSSFVEMFALDGYFASNGQTTGVTRAGASAMAVSEALNKNNAYTQFDFITPLLEHLETQRLHGNWQGYTLLKPIVDNLHNLIAK